MKCSKCGSDNWRLYDYEPSTDTFIYRCDDCCRLTPVKNNAPVKDTISTNKSITTDKQYDICCEYNTLQRCPKCGSFMFHKSDGQLHCEKCEEEYAEIDKNNIMQGNLSPNEVKIVAEKITVTDKTIDVQIDVSEQMLDNVDSIVINGYKFNKE